MTYKVNNICIRNQNTIPESCQGAILQLVPAPLPISMYCGIQKDGLNFI